MYTYSFGVIESYYYYYTWVYYNGNNIIKKHFYIPGYNIIVKRGNIIILSARDPRNGHNARALLHIKLRFIFHR